MTSLTWTTPTPLDIYQIRPLGRMGGLTWQVAAWFLASAQLHRGRLLKADGEAAALLWLQPRDCGRTFVGAVLGQGCWRAPQRVVRAIRLWLDDTARGAYAEPEDSHPSFTRSLEVVGFERRDGGLWQWRS